ncbi:MAG: 4Fe-4S binding protein [Candidatus Brocadiaceae bacterium]|nr:4Fe-4S binding protein [Candidatus Brocadiaceae bacterium]
MEWDKSASALLKKVPPFIQKTVREKVEMIALERGRTLVTEAEVIAAREGFMGKSRIDPSQTKSPVTNEKLSILRKYDKYFDADGNPVLYQVKTCRGAEANCPFLIEDPGLLAKKMRNRFEELHFTRKLMDKIEGQILPHHTMKLAVAGCPNSCSMPQIKDFGVHAIEPVDVDSEVTCIECMKCVEACREDAITVKDARVTIDKEKCVDCGMCARVCPTGTIKPEEVRYRVMVGGRVGRHPKFAMDLLPQADESSTLKALEACIEMMLSSKTEHRFRNIIEKAGIEGIKEKI